MVLLHIILKKSKKTLEQDLILVKKRRDLVFEVDKNEKNKAIGSSFDTFLTEEGISDEVEAGAIKKIIAYQLQEAKKKTV